MKSNLTHYRQATHKLENNYTTSFPRGLKVLNPTSGFPTCGSGMEVGIPRKSGFEDHQGLMTGIPQDWGK